MDRKIVIIVVLVVISLLTLVLLFRAKDMKVVSPHGELVEQTKEATAPKVGGDHGDRGSKALTVVDEQQDYKLEEKKEIIKSLSPKLQKMGLLAEASVHPIEFWGKVVDQHGDPVSGVEVLYYAGGGYLGGGSGYERLKTDKYGRFHITDRKGGSLNIREMNKEGYEIALQQQGTLFYSYDKYPESLIWTDFNEVNPYPYQAWKIDENFVNKEKLVPGEFRVYMKSDGTEYAIDFFELRTKKDSQNLSKGQIKAQFFREEASSRRERGMEWRLVLTALEGGITQAEYLYTSEAPKEGYMESVTLTQDDYKDSQPGEVKNFYLTMKDGTIFARLSFEFNPYFREAKGRIVARYTINPTGERFLDSFDGWVER